MLARVFWFPSSKFLTERWWHRLAIVLAWIWVGIVGIYALDALLLEPWDLCIRVMVNTPDGATPIDCGGNIFGHAINQMANESLPSIVLGTCFVLLVLYVAILVPILAYRVLLYVVTGGKWKEAQRNAA